DLIASSPKQLRLKEVPYHFRTRHSGKSKLDSHAVWGYLMLLADKLVGHIVPVRFVSFALVGAAGVVLHFMVLTTLFRYISLSFSMSQTVATIVAMTSNFVFNNALTYKDRRLQGRQLLTGWLSFVAVCSVGALANIGIASYLFKNDTIWILAALSGILIGAVWNYGVTAIYTWNQQS